ncbi:hypothetical protein [Absidia glauca]|uniref:BHLH domain-containing protein n=1 Tax=Absidia glauca TaxID=4829 RepID=A0A163M8E9_ABSGL|nr:hypothetical protein [Absidia glauca]
MSELSLSNNSNQYDYMVNITPTMVQKVSSPGDMNPSPPVTYDDSTQQYACQEYAFQQMPMVYPSMYPVDATRFDQTAYYDPQGFVQHHQQQHVHPNSPDSFSSSTSSPPTPPSSTSTAKLGHVSTIIMHPSSSTSTTSSSSSSSSASSITTPSIPYTNSHIITSQAIDASSNMNTTPSPIINPLVASSSSTFSNATTARVKETIARANSIPVEFYHTEFLEYSKETYERKMDAKRNKRKRPSQQDHTNGSHSLDTMTKQANSKRTKKQQLDTMNDSDDDFDVDDLENMTDAQGVCNAELRRQIHIQSEQKRRAQIKDGFDELRKHLPGCNNKKMSKAALLTRTVQQMQHLKSMQSELLSEVERLIQENDNLKKFQHGVLQRQAMEKMYNF